MSQLVKPRRIARRALERLGAFAPIYRAIERRVARGDAGEPSPGDTLPMPPPALITLVNGHPSYSWFSEAGAAQAQVIRDLASRHGLRLGGGESVLDFGCGCGRLARWLAPEVVEGGGRFVGGDVNAELIKWCGANLQGDYVLNSLAPPFNAPTSAFDLLYAMSVLTHLKRPTAEAWLDEFARVLKLGGLAVVSFHDEELSPPELRAEVERSGWALTTKIMEGSNYMGAFTTREAFSAICSRRLDVLQIVPGDPAMGRQAVALLRKS